ncbi:glycoside hydrolase [Violaceomyces palustris]|uniref:Glycoside hydrolase n=1 Tax=Violaceomyces palustris TaxID=1673888 RepID=A0ACD0P887_9BASI|nr:glycoside hydrolase [Violaceomyces palustris]
MKFSTIFVALIPLVLASFTKALDNGLALTPQMGWNTWNSYGCNINENIILDAAKAIKAEGLDKFGYNYVVIDDCWQADQRDPETKVIPADPKKFPRGLKAVVDEINALGLKAGIYSSAGTMTCGHHIGSLDYEEIDAKAWAEDGFEYLKYDNCFNEGREGTSQLSRDRYFAMTNALNKTGQPMIYSLCQWGMDAVENWAPTIGNSWRISGDIYPSFNRYDDRCPCEDMQNCKLPGFHCSVAKILEFAAPLGQKAYPGAWNDLDMLEVGNKGMTRDEQIVHFTMWSMVKSPLIMGNVVTAMTNQTRAILTNKHVIDISQDVASSPAIRLWKRKVEDSGGDGNVQLWKSSLSNGTYAVAVINFSNKEQKVKVSFEDVFLDEYLSEGDHGDRAWDAYDLWQGVDFETYSAETRELQPLEGGPFKEELPELTIRPHALKVFKMAPEGTKGLGTSPEELERRSLEEKRLVMMGRAKEWQEKREERRRDTKGL